MAKRKNKGLGVVEAVGALVTGALAGAAAVFFSKEENRKMVQKEVGRAVAKGKRTIKKAEKSVSSLKRKAVSKKRK